MKKLMFATALVASAAAFADAPTAINATSFEGYSAGPVIADKGDVVESGATGGYFCFTGGDSDGSLVKTFGGDNLTAPSARAYYYASASNDKYLELSTEGGTLWRSINTIGGTANAYTLGAETNVAATGTYLDTLVQFTPTEDGNGPTDLEVGVDKLAIWLNVDQQTGTTNLMVRAGWYDVNATPIATNFVLTGKTVVAGEWYRLTIKAIDNIIDTTGIYSEIWKIPAFVIRVDGVEMASAVPPIDASLADLDGAIASDFTTLVSARKVFPSLVVGTCGVPSKLQGVGFKGSGALDDIVWTEDDLFAIPAGIDFTLTWGAGQTAVSYTIGNGEPVAISGDSPFAVPEVYGGETIQFIVRKNGVDKTLTAIAADHESIDATNAKFTWDDYLGAPVDGAYTIDDLTDLLAFQTGVATNLYSAKASDLPTANVTFKLTADIALNAAWPGIGLQNGKDVYSTAAFNAAAFQGTFDGQNHTISGFQMVGVADNSAGGNEGLDYCGFFNSTYGATIQNLKIAYAGSLFAADTTASTKESGATFVGVTKNSTLDNLTTVAGTVSCSKGFGGIVGYLTSGTTVQNCTNNLNMTSLAGNKCGGIAMITQGGSAVTISNCQNNGTQTTGSSNSEYGAIVGYVGLDVTIADCETTVGRFLKHQGNTVTLQGVNKGDPTVPAYHGAATPGLNFATVDGSTATFVADTALAAGNTYKVLGPSATATYEFAAAGSISFDTNLIQAVTFAITAAQGLDAPTETTANGVVTFTVAAAGGDDYVVEIEGSDVVITPQAGDLEALAEAGVDTNSVAAVNAALAQTIEGTSIPAWQALFLGVAPTTNGLETVAIKSISFNSEGKVEVTMADGVTLKTGRGVTINLILKGSDDLATWTTLQTATDTKAFTPVTPALGETKKFYKVVVEFAGSSN